MQTSDSLTLSSYDPHIAPGGLKNFPSYIVG